MKRRNQRSARAACWFVCAVLSSPPGHAAAWEQPDPAADSLAGAPQNGKPAGGTVFPAFAGRLAPPGGLPPGEPETPAWREERYLGDLLRRTPGLFLRDLSSPGQHDSPDFRGAGVRSAALFSGGRPLNDPAWGIANLWYVPLAAAGAVELQDEAGSFAAGAAGEGGTMNLLTEIPRSPGPRSRLLYAESGYDYTRTDGSISQAVSRVLHYTAGFQQQSTDGRFANTAHQQWNGRLGARITVGPRLAVLVSEQFTSAQTELNGGIRTSLSGPEGSFDPLQAAVGNTDSYEKVSRHDLDMTILGLPGDDTLTISSLTLYYSHALREYRDEENRPDPNGILISSDHRTSWMGAVARQEAALPGQHLSAGGEIGIRQVEGSPDLGRRRNPAGAVWVRDRLTARDSHMVTLSLRGDFFRGAAHLSAGGNALFRILPGLALKAGASVSVRPPDYVELSHREGSPPSAFPLREETHRLLEAGLVFSHDRILRTEAGIFHRRVRNPIRARPGSSGVPFPRPAFGNGEDRTTWGVCGSWTARIGILQAEGAATWIRQADAGGISTGLLPPFWVHGGIYLRLMPLGDRLDLQCGFRVRYAAAHRGMLFDPETLVFMENPGEGAGAGGSADAVALARIGDAAVHIVWENITGARSFTAPFYPAPERMIRFGFAWEFRD
ncbi:MAG: TonB-dependent receptor [Bacteroidota bacterium]